MGNNLIELIAALEHEQWVAWSREIAATEAIRPERRARWETYWVPYDQLPEMVKDEDRFWARKVLTVVFDKVREARSL